MADATGNSKYSTFTSALGNLEHIEATQIALQNAVAEKPDPSLDNLTNN